MFRAITVSTQVVFAVMLTACAAYVPNGGDDTEVGLQEQPLTAAPSLCKPRECGPQLGLPNKLCPDGITVSGPSGRCLREPNGSCGWEIIECPDPVCAVVSFGPPSSEIAFWARNFRTGTEAKLWTSQFKSAFVEILPGTCASQRLLCPLIFQPVCAAISGASQQTFGNRCELRRATIAAAGDRGAARSSVASEGSCPQSCASSAECAAGEHCSVDDGDCRRPPGCKPTSICPAVCYGVCTPDVNPCAAVLCPVGTQCVVHDGSASCEPSGISCGPRTCAAGQICCSPSCGICGSKGGLCPAIACVDPL